MYGATVFVWIFVLLYMTTMQFLITDIIDETCVIAVYRSHAHEKAMVLLNFSIMYLLPMLLSVFCYSRIVYALRCKVNLLL